MIFLFFSLIVQALTPQEISKLIINEYQESKLISRKLIDREFLYRKDNYHQNIEYFVTDSMSTEFTPDTVLCTITHMAILKCGLTEKSFIRRGEAAYWQIFSIKDSIIAVTHVYGHYNIDYISVNSILERDSLFLNLVKGDIENLGCEFRKEEEPEEQE